MKRLAIKEQEVTNKYDKLSLEVNLIKVLYHERNSGKIYINFVMNLIEKKEITNVFYVLSEIKLDIMVIAGMKLKNAVGKR